MKAEDVMEKEEIERILVKHPGATLELALLTKNGKATEDVDRADRGRLAVLVDEELVEEIHFTFTDKGRPDVDLVLQVH